MINKTEVKVIELSGVKLTPGAKYIFLLNPLEADQYQYIAEDLGRLIGLDNFSLILIHQSDMKVLEVLPSEDGDALHSNHSNS